MKVLKPVGKDNPLTQGYKPAHKGYDHDDKPDANYRSSFHGVVVQSKNSETRHWIANTASDPYKPASGTRQLRTEDYGNYIKIKAQVDGKTVYQLGAHFEPGSVLPKGTQVKAGQVVARIGHTGNSTGSHCHTEYRDESNQNFSVEFTDQVTGNGDTDTDVNKKQQYIDIYLATRPSLPPSDDELNHRLQENKNIVEVGRDILGGDGNARTYWLEHWGVKQDINKDEAIDRYKDLYYRLKEILRPAGLEQGADDAEMLAKASWIVSELQRLQNEAIPKTIYKHEGKDYEKLISVGNLTLIIEKAG